MKISVGAVVQGGTSVAYPTGTWRDQRPLINQEACKACDICYQVCPDSSILKDNKVYSIDYLYCKGCGLCAYECPTRAITMTAEEK